MEVPEQIQKFRQIEVETLLNPDFGSKNFIDIKPKFEEKYSMISEMIDVAYSIDGFPEGLKSQLLTIVNQFNGFYSQIESYSIDKDGQQNFRGHQQIQTNFNNWYNWNFQGTDNQNKSRNFLTVYNSCKNLEGQSLSNDQKRLKDFIGQAKNAKGDIESILEQLRLKAAGEVVVDYAEIFLNQARKHSHFSIRIWPLKRLNFSVGVAEVWLILAFLSGASLITSINFLNEIFPVESTEADKNVKILMMITRFAFISFLLFVVTFCFKQYSINKHLFTVNRHRQNTLASYKLFLQSISKDDTAIRNALMMEVAKSIYEAGSTGFISGKKDNASPSIIELTRLIKDNK